MAACQHVDKIKSGQSLGEEKQNKTPITHTPAVHREIYEEGIA